jgi:predicted O-methyltransferase YrrM
MEMDIFSAVDGYIGGLFAQEDEALIAALKDMREAGMPEINVSPVLGRYLQMMARLAGARRILEVGTLGGYSTIWLARALPEGGKLVSLEIDSRYAEIACCNISRAQLSGSAEVLVGPAAESMRQLIAGGAAPFDMIFIDADKESYTEYFELSLQLSRPGTLIAADNTVRAGRVLDPEAIESDKMVAGVVQFASALAKSSAVEATMIQWVGARGHDGVALATVKSGG